MRNYHLTSLKALFDPIIELVIIIYLSVQRDSIQLDCLTWDNFPLRKVNGQVEKRQCLSQPPDRKLGMLL